MITPINTLLGKWYVAKLNKLMYSDPEAAIYRQLQSRHEVKRAKYKEEQDENGQVS